MFRAEDYVKVEDLDEAYELCQKRSSLIVGGMAWLKMSSVTKRVIIDLSGLGLDTIEETDREFRIGCMCTLRQLETHPGLNQYFNGIFKECPRIISERGSEIDSDYLQIPQMHLVNHDGQKGFLAQYLSLIHI